MNHFLCVHPDEAFQDFKLTFAYKVKVQASFFTNCFKTEGQKEKEDLPTPYFKRGAFDTHKFPKNQAHFDPHNKDHSILINEFS